MANEHARQTSCPYCQVHQIECVRDHQTLPCRECMGRLLREGFIEHRSAIFNSEAARLEIFRDKPFRSLPTLDIHDSSLGNNQIGLQMTLTPGYVSINYQIVIEEKFGIYNPMVINWIISLVMENLTAGYHGTDKSSEVIFNAVFTGGLLHLLRSVMASTEQVVSTIDKLECDNEYEQHSLGVHFQWLVFQLICRGLDHALSVLEDGHGPLEYTADASDLFTSVSILYREISQSIESLRSGNCYLSRNLKAIILDGLTYVEKQLEDWIYRGCNIFPDWQDALQLSGKGLRPEGQTIALAFTLRRNKFTSFTPEPPPSNYKPDRDGDVFLLSAPSTPEMKVATVSYYDDDPLDLTSIPAEMQHEAPVVSPASGGKDPGQMSNDFIDLTEGGSFLPPAMNHQLTFRDLGQHASDSGWLSRALV